MKIGEIRRICEKECGLERNFEIYAQLNKITDEMLCDFDKSILDVEREKNPLQNIDEIMDVQNEDGKGTFRSSFYNTWPFGVPTDEIFPRFLAVCRGKQQLGGVLKKVLEQSKKIAEKYRDDDYARKTVLVLTDKWNVAIFKRYEKKLLDYALNDGIWYIFLLVTEYGYTQIPFLPNDRDALKELRGENIEDDITLKDMLMRLEGMPVVYSMTGGTWRPYGGAEYIFDVDGMWWEKESMQEGPSEGRIGARARKRFLERTSWIIDIERDIVPKSRALDSPVHRLRMYGKEIEWDSCFMDENGDERMIKLQEAIDRFIKDCERETRYDADGNSFR